MRVAGLLTLCCLLWDVAAFRVPSTTGRVSRREALAGAAAGAFFAASPLAAVAVDVNDLTRLNKGLEQVQFLLDNWDKETVDPISGNDDPDREPR